MTSLKDQIDGVVDNLNRDSANVDVWVNGGISDSYTDTQGRVVPSIQNLTNNISAQNASLLSYESFESSTSTGDGSTTTFALSFTPLTTTTQAFLVAIDGVLQSPVDAYSISTDPAQVIFTGAPPEGAQIVVTTALAPAHPNEIQVATRALQRRGWPTVFKTPSM